MDPLRVPSKGQKDSFSIRFNATDDSLDDIYNTATHRPGSTPGQPLLQSNPVQHQPEESTWKRDFLQTSFFSRKRSNSIENNSISAASVSSIDPATSAPVVVPSPNNQGSSSNTVVGSSSSSHSTGMDTTTWARFKGKVNQAMEDIKSSSQKVGSLPVASSSAVVGTTNVNCSGGASVNGSQTTQSSISEDYLDPESEVNGDVENSDDDVDSEIFNVAGGGGGGAEEQDSSAVDTRTSRLKRSIRHIRNNKEAIKGSLRKAKETTKDKMFGRTTTKTEDNEVTTEITKNATVAATDPVEIESGVEMVEDMVVAAAENHTAVSSDSRSSSASSGDLKVRSASAPNELHFLGNGTKDRPTSAPTLNEPSISSSSTNASAAPPPNYVQLVAPILSAMIQSRNFGLCVALVAILLSVSMPPFLQGVLTCLLSMVAISTLHQFVCDVVVAIVSRNNPLGPAKLPFVMPDYNKMPICEIPAAEEHTSLKSYCGWLNEVNHYDPENYHLGMMKSVYVKLDGTRLKVSNVANRIPKRSMWNEPVVERRHIIVTMNRTFDLRNCRIEMLPKGLARKRYFNRKYPMQLVIPNGLVSQEQQQQDDDEKKRLGGGGGTPPTSTEKLLFLNELDSTDFGTTILTADTSTLLVERQSQGQLKVNELRAKSTTTKPSGDEVRLIFFARCDREKEDWYRRFQSASIGAVRDSEHPTANFKFVSESVAQAMRQVTQSLENLPEEMQKGVDVGVKEGKAKKETTETETEETEVMFPPESQFDGLLMTPCSARSHPEYVKFMGKYQSAIKRKRPPKDPIASPEKKSRRERKEDELWKGIDQSLFLGPTADVVWANVLIGRLMYSCLKNDVMLEKIQDFLQKKLSAIKLPNFMEDVTIAQLCLGDQPPLIHRISQPLMDERGTWIDADLTYEGLVHATVTTKLNLLRLRKQQGAGGGGGSSAQSGPDVAQKKSPVNTTARLQMSAIYDSDAESTGGSSSESESSTPPVANLIVDSNAPGVATVGGSGQGMGVEVLAGSAAAASSTGGGRKLLRIVDKITASNLFQSATEISYVQRAMENMSTRIKLRVELKGLVSRVVVNIPPPPSDRVWIGFRGPPRLYVVAKPALGQHAVDWSLVTNVIENKLCEEVYKYLVYPNMVDVIVPILGQPTYMEDDETEEEEE